MRSFPILRLGFLLLLAGCGGGEDFSRPGTWQPMGANEANLRAMVADPAHLQQGVGAETERGQPASLAIRRLERGLRPPLPATRASGIGAAETPVVPAGDVDAR